MLHERKRAVWYLEVSSTFFGQFISGWRCLWTEQLPTQPNRRFTKLCWVGKYINIIMKPTNSPTQGQLNPRKNRLKVAFGPLFPTATNFSWLGIGFTQQADYKKTKSTKLSANPLLFIHRTLNTTAPSPEPRLSSFGVIVCWGIKAGLSPHSPPRYTPPKLYRAIGSALLC